MTTAIYISELFSLLTAVHHSNTFIFSVTRTLETIRMTTPLRLISTATSRHLRFGKRNLLCLAAHGNQIPTASPDRVLFSSFSSDAKPPVVGSEWRKAQLDKLENKFKGKQTEVLDIESEEDLQPMWKEMEGRVTRRKPRTLADTGGKSGRMNIKKTDEDVWLEQGLYQKDDSDSSKKD